MLTVTTNGPSRIRTGMAILDQVLPGWYQHIDCVTLDISSPACCILGQLFGTYRHGLHTLDIEVPSTYGFVASGDVRFDELTDLWRSAIAKRRLADWERVV